MIVGSIFCEVLIEFVDVSFLLGRSNNFVDSNMKLLKDRIEVIRTKERLERNYRPRVKDYTSKYINPCPEQQPEKESEYLQTLALICGTFSSPILVGVAFLCIFYVLVHLKI